MKRIILVTMFFLAATFGYASDSNAYQEGSIVYDSATNLGNAVVIVNPRLILAGGVNAYFLAFDSSMSIDSNRLLGGAFCLAIGMKSGIISEKDRVRNNPIAVLDRNGQLDYVGNDQWEYGIKVVTCQK